MAQPSVEKKLEIILAADPRSRVFVELARLLVERGEHARAIEICRNGLEHHADSVLARILWGRALLGLGQRDEAASQFEIAIAIDPANPYAYNLAGEALFERKLYRLSLPILARAAQLQPSDERIRVWLEEAKREATNEPPPPEPKSTPAPTDDTPDSAKAAGKPVGPVVTPPPRAPPPLKQTPPPRSGGPAPRPPPIRQPSNPRLAALSMIPDRDARPPRPAAPEPAAPSAAEAEQIAQKYEHELRQKFRESQKPPGFFRRHLVATLVIALSVILGAGGGGTYWYVRRQNRTSDVRGYVEAAKKGLARDTIGSLQDAATVLAEARDLDAKSSQAISLSAQVSALLASDYGDKEATALAKQLAASKGAGDGALVANWLLAASESERNDAAKAILDTNPSGFAPLVHEIAGKILLSRKEKDQAIARFTAAAQGTPPSLRALADLGDVYREQGSLDAALESYRVALEAHATHPRSVIGAAEVRFQLRREIPDAVAQLKALDQDAGSAPAIPDRLRFEIIFAKCLSASGDRATAIERLDRASERFSGQQAELAAGRSEVYSAAGAFDKAAEEAGRAAKLAPGEPAYLLLRARAELAGERYRELLKATERTKVREIHLYRAMARYELKDYKQARLELDQTRRGKSMPAEAVAYYALVELGAGRVPEARKLAEQLVASPSPHPLAYVVLGRIEAATGNIAAAEQQFRAAVERDPSYAEGQRSLGRLLLGQGNAAQALESLEAAAKIDPFNVEGQKALGRAKLILGDPTGARTAFEAVLEQRIDGEALRGLSAAQLALSQPGEALRTAEQAIRVDGGNVESYATAVRAAFAKDDKQAARHFAEQGLKAAKKAKLDEQVKELFEDAMRGQ